MCTGLRTFAGQASMSALGRKRQFSYQVMSVRSRVQSGRFMVAVRTLETGGLKDHFTTFNFGSSGLSNKSIVCLNRSFFTNAAYAFSVVLTEA